MNFYKIINGKLVSGSGVKAPDDTWETDWAKLDSKEDDGYYTYYKDDFTVDAEKEMAEDKANTLQAMESAIQSHIDAQAKKLGYDNIGSIGKYLGYDNPFRTECEKLGVFNSNCWIKSFEVQTQVEGGEIPMPTVDELIAMMPEYV